MAENEESRQLATTDNALANASSSNEEVQNRPDGQQQQQPQPQFSLFQLLRGLIINAAIVYFISSLFRRPQPQATNQSVGPTKFPSSNLFENGTIFDMYVYLSEAEVLKDFETMSNQLIWKEEGMIYGDWYSGPNGDGTFTSSFQFDTTENLRNNGSIYIHVYLVIHGNSPNPKDKESYSGKYTVYKHKMLNRYKKKRYLKTHNLLTGQTAETPENVKKAELMETEIVSHWHPNLTINVVDDHTPWVEGSIPSPLDEFIEFEMTSGKYYPIVHINDYWNLLRDYQPITKDNSTLNLTLTYQPLSLFRWQLYTAQGVRSKWTSSFLGDAMEESDEDQDTLKETFLETNPYLLAMTVAVSILHSIFEFLAFKNDIQFWNNRTSLEGLSVRSVFFNVFQSLIVLLYVLDNETNTVVRISVFVGLGIEIWKIHKVVNIQISSENKILGIIPRIILADKGSYAESPTKIYDKMAFKYLSWALFPLLGGYAVYSLLYLEHKGWYSWVLSMLYGFLLTFGFIMMTPQLFINYKLKSVAHLPWRMMTYKALNTFIDDIFAFVIKMPTMYRLGCFRDDIIFFVYLYQRWIYRVDPKRINEFGISGEMVENAANQNTAAQNTAPQTQQVSKKSPQRKKKD
ncbi:Cleft lip and palate transmembrane protein 1 like protein [Chamberlinius hualienensis]